MSYLKSIFFAAMGLGFLAGPAGAADVDRIREKAVELEQSLAAHNFDVEVKGEKSNLQRVYKDYAFLFTDSQIKKARKAGAERLALYLEESTMLLELASYIDDLHNKQSTEPLDFDGQEKTQAELRAMLNSAPDAATRRKLYSALKESFELDGIFLNQIVTLQNELTQAAGYDDYAAFYARREAVDLDAAAAEAQAFLKASQAMYDELFEAVAMERLGEEPRKVKFLDFGYLTRPEGGGAGNEAYAKVCQGLGVGDLVSKVPVDNKNRPGRVAGSGVYPLNVPQQVEVGVTPTGTSQDVSLGLRALGEAGLYAYSTATQFEAQYLLPQAVQAALGYLVRYAGEAAGEVPHGTLLAYTRLLEARRLAAQVVYEVAVYRGAADADDLFRDVMREAYGSRLSSSDVKRRFEFATSLASVSRFQGLMAAYSIGQAWESEYGADWYAGGNVGSNLKGWFAQGGNLTFEAFIDGLSPGGEAMIQSIKALQ